MSNKIADNIGALFSTVLDASKSLFLFLLFLAFGCIALFFALIFTVIALVS